MNQNDLKNKETIVQIRKQLHTTANQPPNADPFSRDGHQAWQDWIELCMGYETELRIMGEEL